MYVLDSLMLDLLNVTLENEFVKFLMVF